MNHSVLKFEDQLTRNFKVNFFGGLYFPNLLLYSIAPIIRTPINRTSNYPNRVFRLLKFFNRTSNYPNSVFLFLKFFSELPIMRTAYFSFKKKKPPKPKYFFFLSLPITFLFFHPVIYLFSFLSWHTKFNPETARYFWGVLLVGRENTKGLKKGVEKPRSKHKIPVCIFLPPPSLWTRVAITSFLVSGC